MSKASYQGPYQVKLCKQNVLKMQKPEVQLFSWLAFMLGT